MPLRNFKELLDEMPPERRQRIENRAKELLDEMPPEDFRESEELAALVCGGGIGQDAAAAIARDSNLRVTALANYVEALGGHLEIRAVFPDHQVLIHRD